MMLRPFRLLQLLLLLLLLHMSSSAVHNNATEALHLHHDITLDPEEKPATEDSNQARSGGKGRTDAADNGPDQNQVGCRELRSTKYISDGQCTSINPIKELVCAGECLPSHLLPNWIGSATYSGRYWSRRDAQEWRCVINQTRIQRIQLQCPDGSFRTYKITVVTSCKCRRNSRQHNESGHKDSTTQIGKQKKNPEKARELEVSAGRQPDT